MERQERKYGTAMFMLYTAMVFVGGYGLGSGCIMETKATIMDASKQALVSTADRVGQSMTKWAEQVPLENRLQK